MLEIYHRPNSKRARESAFLSCLCDYYPEAKHKKEDFSFDESCLNCLINKEALVSALRKDCYLPDNRRKDFIEKLSNLPPQLKVATYPSRISFDFVVCKDGQPYFWEFHEEQHRTLQDRRPKKLFKPDGTPICVERGLQRFVRDVWKAQYFRPYTIVWSDWFEANKEIYKPVLRDGFNECAEPKKFSFKRFCEGLSGGDTGE